jgi:hypothetical protein
MKKRFVALALFAGAAVMVCSLTPSGARAGTLRVAPLTLSFGQVAVKQTGGPQTVRLSTYFPIPIARISITGDFAQNNNCPSRLSQFGMCSVMVTFTPTALGPRAGALTIATGAGNPPSSI